MTASIAQPAAVAAWSVEIRRGDAALAGLAADWDGLHARCAGAAPFQSYAWLHSWWRSYGRSGALRVFLVRHGGTLVAAAAFALRGRVLVPIGGDLTDFTDVLLDDEQAAAAAHVLATALIRDRGWHTMDFGEARPGAATARLLVPAWPGRVFETPGSLCLELAAGPFDDLVAALPAHSRKTVRRRLNQLRKAAPEITTVPAASAGPAVAELLRLHQKQWEGRGGNPAHRTAAFAEHLTRSVTAMIESGHAALIEYRFAGRLQASSLLLIGNDLVGGYLFGVDPALRGRIDVTTMLLADALGLADRLDRPTMSMLRGDEAHKSTWRPSEVRNRRLLLVRPGSAGGTAYARGVLARRRLIASLKTHAPWIRQLRNRLRTEGLAATLTPRRTPATIGEQSKLKIADASSENAEPLARGLTPPAGAPGPPGSGATTGAQSKGAAKP
ncbi:GNAT family N-acetyltransferase [Actinoplanes sp. NPDC049265]|uniref:GNAT family N-acetyltransferase n=1 Tax=Actinoplanes sp. NPDC049265 TaxID=3363902 RepID=UPI0037190BF4